MRICSYGPDALPCAPSMTIRDSSTSVRRVAASKFFAAALAPIREPGEETRVSLKRTTAAGDHNRSGANRRRMP